MDVSVVKGYFSEERTVLYYARSVARVGLWRSEEKLIRDTFEQTQRILDLGCGAGRVAVALRKLGYADVHGADLSPEMARAANSIAGSEGLEISFGVEDATRLSYGDASFDGVIFAFNGLMQIPGRANRRQAMREIRRILRVGGMLIFTTLDRDSPLYREIFAERSNPEHDLLQNDKLVEFGDRHFSTDHGYTFMHVPLRREIAEDLAVSGFELLSDRMRSEIANEPKEVRQFSEDCRFWVARKA